MILLSIPFVQTQLGKKATNSLNKAYNTQIYIDKVSFNIFGPSVSLKGIYIQDHHSDTLAYIGALNTSISDIKKIQSGDLLLNTISLEKLDLIVKNYKNETDTNLDVFIDHFMLKNSSEKKKPSTFFMNAKNVEIENSRFRFINKNLETTKILDFKDLNIYGKNLEINGPNVKVAIVDAKMLDYRGVNITSLKTDFSYSLTKMKFENIQLLTSNSTSLKGKLNFNYKRSDFSDFNNKVKLDADFKKSSISFTDLNFFTNIFGEGIANFKTNINGTFNNLKMPNLKLYSLNNTKIESDLNFENLLSKNSPFKLVANVKNISSTYTDLRNMLPSLLGDKLPSFLRNLGVFTTEGKFIISKNEVDINAKLNSTLGVLKPTLIFSNLTKLKAVNYKGSVNLEGFNLGRLLENNNIGKATLKVDLKGLGFDIENMNSFAKIKVKKVGVNNYTYEGVNFETNINNKILSCQLYSKDINLNGNLIGEIDMTQEKNNYEFKSIIDFANLKKLNIVSRDSIANFKGVIDVNLNGSSVNDLYGTVNLNKINYTNEYKIFEIDNFRINSNFDNQNIRTISFSALNYLTGKVNGKFKFKELLSLAKNDLGIIYSNYSPIKVSKEQFFDFNLKIDKNFTELFYPNLKIDDNLKVSGKISSNEEDFKLNLKSSKLIFNKNVFENVNIKLDNSNPFYNAYVTIDDIKTNLYDISDFNLVNKTISDTLFFRTEFKGGKEKRDVFNLNLYLADDLNKKTVLGFKKSDLKINDYNWFINELNSSECKLVFDKNFNNISLNEFKISHKDEFLKLYGFLKGDTKKNINLEINKVSLATLLPETKNFNFRGIANGNLKVNQDNKGYKPTANIELADFGINGVDLGLFKLDIQGNELLNNYTINSSINNGFKNILNVNGGLNLANKNPHIDLNLNLSELNLSFFNGLGDDVVNNIRGLVSGNAKLFGKYNNPNFSGELNLDKAGMNIPYLNIDFNLKNKSKVLLNNKKFVFNNINLIDTKHNSSGFLNGFISHNYFTDWNLGMDISSDNLLVLDTQQSESSLYYGKAFINGKAQLTGPTSDLLITVKAKTNKGTVFKIPISDSKSVGDNAFIKTVSKYDRFNNGQVKANLPIELSGLELLFDLDVTPDAEIEIVLDQEAGSVLKGRGNGLMRIEINTNDKFNMYGDFVVSEGTYNFVYGNNFLQGGFIEKRFKVNPGGTINWDGNPFNARINMDAVYSTSSNPALLLDNPSVNRKIPVDVVINLNGGLMQPDVNFSIEFPKTNSVIKSELLYKLDDKEFRDKQALSLVTTGQFIGSYAYGQGAVTGNLVERATTLVNNMLNNADDKFKIGLNYEQGENNPLEEQRIEDRLGITISTQISDKILINGKVGIPVGGVSKTVVAGDVQIEFLLNDDGTLRAKIFNRENDLSQFTSVSDEIGYTQGIGISNEIDFDTFEELINKIFRGKNNPKKENKESEKNQNDFIITRPKSN